MPLIFELLELNLHGKLLGHLLLNGNGVDLCGASYRLIEWFRLLSRDI